LWVIDGYNTGEFNISLSPLQLPLVGAAVYGFIQTVPFGWHTIAGIDNVPRTISVDTFSTRVNALHFAALSLFFSVGLTLINSAKRIRRTVTVLTIFGFIFAFFAILQGVLSPTKIYGIYERQFAQPYGSFVNRHNFAAYMEMTMSLPLALVLTGVIKRDQRLLYLTAILLMGVALFLSGSRGGLIALLAEVMLIVLITAPIRGGRRIAWPCGKPKPPSRRRYRRCRCRRSRPRELPAPTVARVKVWPRQPARSRSPVSLSLIRSSKRWITARW
jgi:hypothetical protein